MPFKNLFFRQTLFCAAFLLALSAVAFCRIPSLQFVNYDDSTYLVQNPYIVNGFTPQGIRWAVAVPALSRSADYSPFWRPLTYFSHMLDFQLFGLKPAGHHAMSLLLHFLNAMLLCLLLTRASGERIPSMIAAALFAVHPLQVETVAWISARNALLSMFFALVATLYYLDYVQKKHKRSFIASILCFLLCLFCKSTLVGLPFLLLLLDYWPLRRGNQAPPEKNLWGSLLLEKWPFLVLAAAASIFTLLRPPEALHTAMSQTIFAKIAHSLFAYVFYLSKVFFPVRLALFYPQVTLTGGPMMVLLLLTCLLLLAITLMAVLLMKRYPFFLTGWAWFVITLFPVSFLPQKADRYMYEPLAGLSILAAWSGWMVFSKIKKGKSALAACSVLLLMLLATLSQIQTRVWANSITLYENALKIYPNTFEARINLGNAFGEKQMLDRAIEQFALAIKLNPNSPGPYENLGNALLLKGAPSLSEQAFQKTLELAPNNANAWRMLGWFAKARGAWDQALTFYSRSLSLKEDSAIAHADIASLYQMIGKNEEASAHYARSLHYDPRNDAVRAQWAELLSENPAERKT